MGGRNERYSGAPIHQVRPPAPALWVWAHQLTPPLLLPGCPILRHRRRWGC